MTAHTGGRNGIDKMSGQTMTLRIMALDDGGKPSIGVETQIPQVAAVSNSLEKQLSDTMPPEIVKVMNARSGVDEWMAANMKTIIEPAVRLLLMKIVIPPKMNTEYKVMPADKAATWK